MFTEITLREFEVKKSGIGFLQLVVHPIDCTGFVFDSSAGLRVILHDLTGANLPIDIDLPEDYLFVLCGTQGILTDCIVDLLFVKMMPKKVDEMGIAGN